MDTIQITYVTLSSIFGHQSNVDFSKFTTYCRPLRPPPGVGVGVENKDSKYNNNTYYVPLSADKNFEKSPYHRAALGEHPKSALLSGAQRVIVKNTKSPTLDSAHHTPTQRGTNNFMRPTESSRFLLVPFYVVLLFAHSTLIILFTGYLPRLLEL